MGIPQSQLMAPLEQEPSVPKSVRRPKFHHDLYDSSKESKFVDPQKEAQLLIPEQTVASAQLALEIMAPEYATKKKEGSVFSSVYEYLMSLFQQVKKKLRGSRRRKAKLTKKGEETLEQLKYLAQLCDATSCRSPEEILEAEGAFGEAYFEIMQLSSNLEKMSQSEQEHHMHRYGKHMSRLLETD
ncbi:Uncharacterised protein [uncultured archaeon]|nr:Uncharacterised protein [uncultured archaeon]